MEKPRHVFTEMNLVLELIQESQVKSKSPRKKKEYIFVTLILEIFLEFVFYLNT